MGNVSKLMLSHSSFVGPGLLQVCHLSGIVVGG